MKARRIASILMYLVLSVCLIFLGYRFLQWRQDQEKRKELFVYFQKKSEVTRRLPADAVAYLNLYQFKKVYEGLEGTKFYDVLAHWFDTGMSDKQKANPLLGGMLEKTIVDMLGEEFGLAVVPASGGKIDYVAVARVAPGSQFILKLALASAKNTRSISFNGETIYAFPTKDASYPEVFVYLGDDFAFSSSNLERLKHAAAPPGTGPAFLVQLPVVAVPQDTFLFVETKQPQFSVRGFGGFQDYHLKATGQSRINSHLPNYRENDHTVFWFQTNGTEIWNQPATTFVMQSFDGQPGSHLLFTYADSRTAKDYSEFLLNDFNAKVPTGRATEIINEKGFECYQYDKNGSQQYVCRGDAAVMLARGRLDLANFGFRAKKLPARFQPLVVQMNFHPERVEEFLQKTGKKDWSDFGIAKEFYFLSCIKSLTGGIDASGNEIDLELQ